MNRLPVLFQDEHYVAVAKPGGMLTHRTAGAQGTPLLQRLRQQLGQHLFPVHRLDRATSGVVVFALSSQAAAQLGKLFAERAVEKTYWAVVRGYLPEKGLVDYPLASSADKPAREAITRYRRLFQTALPFVVGRYPTARYSLVEAMPQTGRYHQIRRHFAHISHPVVGDTVHGDGRHNQFFRDHFRLHRLMLMARFLRFRHPYTGSQVEIEAPVEAILADCLGQLWPQIHKK